MNSKNTIKINFRGGIISPGDLLHILDLAAEAGLDTVRFGLRQQMLLAVSTEKKAFLVDALSKLEIAFEEDDELFPNVVSSYPAEEIFITNTWMTEGTYKDIFDGMDFRHRLKVNLSDSNQSFTPMLTGNINWVASVDNAHFWHLFIRFPKTNVIYEWSDMVYTNDIPRMSKELEVIIFENKEVFYDNANAKGERLMSLLAKQQYNTKPAEKPAILPSFNLPYYEGLNKYGNKYWLGVYRRDELFSIDFLRELCLLCLQTKIGQICSTPWKSLIVKGIEEKDRTKWNVLLERHRVNMRHAANELNFQVEDVCDEGLALKKYLVKKFNDKDMRTFGLCIGIKTRAKNEVFSSVLIKRKAIKLFPGISLFNLYDILCAHDYNPNQRTGFVFSKNIPKWLLVSELKKSVDLFYSGRENLKKQTEVKVIPQHEYEQGEGVKSEVYQCQTCFTIYHPEYGDPQQGIACGTSFGSLPETYTCGLCESGKDDFLPVDEHVVLHSKTG